jgi:hypothetical protein
VSFDPDTVPDSPALTALTALGRDAVSPHTPAELDEGFEALRRRAAVSRARRRVLVPLVAIGVAAASAALVFRLATNGPGRAPGLEPEPAVAVARIEGGALLEGGYLSRSGRADVTVVFNEGSSFELMPGARGRLRAVDESGTQMAIEHGTASLRITPSRTHLWFVEAGPFRVTVTGTVFSVSWDPSSERFDLSLKQGRVVVTGPSGEIALRAGQRLLVQLPEGETLITDEPPAPAAGAASPAPGPATRARPAAPLRPAPQPPAKAGVRRRWAAALARGSWDGILADVDRDGVDATLEAASSEDLFALADAARYRRRTDLARAALLAERRRFPQAPRSVDALFLLGRVEELRAQGAARAIAFYDDYLAEAPAGAYAAEALGRKMILTDEKEGRAAARPIAGEYLRRFPGGSYAGSARALQRAP